MSSHPTNSFCGDNNCLSCGNYLAGLVDGEGCFFLEVCLRTAGNYVCVARLDLAMRADELDLLRQIKRFLGCGTLSVVRKSGGSNPIAHLVVTKVVDLVRKVIPLFERFPLRAKKARDFVVWKDAVRFMYQVQQRPLHCRGKGGGFERRWKWDEIERVRELCDELRRVRKYVGPDVTEAGDSRRELRKNGIFPKEVGS